MIQHIANVAAKSLGQKLSWSVIRESNRLDSIELRIRTLETLLHDAERNLEVDLIATLFSEHKEVTSVHPAISAVKPCLETLFTHDLAINANHTQIGHVDAMGDIDDDLCLMLMTIIAQSHPFGRISLIKNIILECCKYPLNPFIDEEGFSEHCRSVRDKLTLDVKRRSWTAMMTFPRPDTPTDSMAELMNVIAFIRHPLHQLLHRSDWQYLHADAVERMNRSDFSFLLLLPKDTLSRILVKHQLPTLIKDEFMAQVNQQLQLLHTTIQTETRQNRKADFESRDEFGEWLFKTITLKAVRFAMASDAVKKACKEGKGALKFRTSRGFHWPIAITEAIAATLGATPSSFKVYVNDHEVDAEQWEDSKRRMPQRTPDEEVEAVIRRIQQVTIGRPSID